MTDHLSVIDECAMHALDQLQGYSLVAAARIEQAIGLMQETMQHLSREDAEGAVRRMLAAREAAWSGYDG